MIFTLRVFFLLVAATMLLLTGWAGSQVSLWSIPDPVLRHPWFIATLADAGFAFLAFYAWAAWKEGGLVTRALWLLATLSLGSMAIAAYFLRELFSVPRERALDAVFTRRYPPRPVLPAVLAILGLAAWGVPYALAP